MTKIEVVFVNGTTMIREVRTTALAEVARELNGSPNVESWKTL